MLNALFEKFLHMNWKSIAKFLWLKPALYGLTNFSLFVAGSSNLVLGTLSAWNGRVDLAATSLTAGLILLFAATIDRFESLKGLGVEAKTRQLDKKLVEADDALKRIKELAELTTNAIINLNNSRGRFDSVASARETYETAQKVRQMLTSLGSEPAVIRETIAPWVNIFLLDTARAISKPLTKLLNDKNQELQREFQSIGNPINLSDPVYVRNIACREEVNNRIAAIKKTTEGIYQGGYTSNDFLLLFESAQFIVEEALRPIREKAQSLCPVMESLVRNQMLETPEVLIDEIDALRKAEQS